MKKHRTDSSRVVASTDPPSVAVQLPFPLLATLKSARQDFLSLCVTTGSEVLAKMMEFD